MLNLTHRSTINPHQHIANALETNITPDQLMLALKDVLKTEGKFLVWRIEDLGTDAVNSFSRSYPLTGTEYATQRGRSIE